MAISKITNWLNSQRIFSEGAALYKYYGKDNFFKIVLSSGYSKTVYNRLVTELVALEHSEDDKIVQPVENNLNPLPEDLMVLQKRCNDQYSRLRLLHADLPKTPTEVRRKHLCFEILSGFRMIDEMYEQINYYKANGKRMPSPTVKQVDENVHEIITLKNIVDDMKLIPPNISKTKGKMKDIQDEQKLKDFTAKIQQWEDRYALILSIIEEKGDMIIHETKLT